jgi:hypothetical protein
MQFPSDKKVLYIKSKSAVFVCVCFFNSLFGNAYCENLNCEKHLTEKYFFNFTKFNLR